jgi:hypothetical protein
VTQIWFSFLTVRRDSAVGIAISYWLDDQGFVLRVPMGSRIFTSPCRSDRLWGLPNHLSNWYCGLFPRRWSGRGVKLTTHLQLVPRSRKRGSIQPLPYTPSWPSAYWIKHRYNIIFSALRTGTHKFGMNCEIWNSHSNHYENYSLLR